MRNSSRNLLDMNSGGRKLKKARMKKKHKIYLTLLVLELEAWTQTWKKTFDLPEARL